MNKTDKKGKIFVVGTPIGNLDDLSQRALNTLLSVDIILCENPKVTKKLLDNFHIDTKITRYHQHTGAKKRKKIRNWLKGGKSLAIVTDAGTPGISDPGNRLLDELYNEEIGVIPIPGPSAIVTALSVCGFPTTKFMFLGFPPHKKKRKKFFEEVADFKYTVGFYESSHRIKKALNRLREVLGADRQVCVCRELTKKFESIYRGNMEEISNMDIPDKGEFVIIVSK